jgi:YVTN family beta-propeller protein
MQEIRNSLVTLEVTSTSLIFLCVFVSITVTKLSLVLVTIAKPLFGEITINGGNKIHIKRTQSLPGDPKNMESSYYADVHPDGKHIYIGSSTKSTKGANVGYMHVINRDNMKIVSTIKTGFGSARTTFIPKRGLAIVTNTKDNFVTVINTKTHKKIKDINVTSGTMIFRLSVAKPIIYSVSGRRIKIILI